MKGTYNDPWRQYRYDRNQADEAQREATRLLLKAHKSERLAREATAAGSDPAKAAKARAWLARLDEATRLWPVTPRQEGKA